MFMRMILAVAMLACLSAAHADTSAGTKAEQAACRPDVRRLCGHIGKAENDKYRECLQMHFSELSQKCQQVLMNHPNQ